MAGTPTSDELKRQALQAFNEAGSESGGARLLGIDRSTYRHRLAAARSKPPAAEFETPELPDELPTADELLARRRTQFARKATAKEARRLVDIKVKIDGPFGVALMGDPHVDDDGTDIALLERHVEIINATEGLFGGNIGDFSNNWVGRLARLYGEQSLSAQEAWVLVEWLIKSVPWMFLIGGNHDLWSGAGDPIKWMAKSARVTYEANGMRMGLRTPKGRTIRINARHDFKGHSQWNVTHGPAKAAQMGWRDHLLICGHLHTSGYQVLRDPSSGLLSHVIRAGSYKTYDKFADEHGLPNQTFSVCPVAVIRPQFADDDTRLIQVFFEPETAAEFLSFLRRRKSERAA